MIICPSCSTRYRHRVERDAPPAMAECARCEASFPLVPARAGYRLVARSITGVASGAAAGAMTIGIDDRSISAHLQAAAGVAGAADPAGTTEFPSPVHDSVVPPVEGRVDIDLPAAVEDDPFGGALTVDPGPATIAARPDHLDPFEEPRTVEPSTDSGTVDTHPAAAPGEIPRPRPGREFVGTLLLAGLGVAGGYQASVLTGTDTMAMMAVGAAAGLLLGWSWIRWVARRHC